ncbi:MAG: hypothetical protein F2793_02020 [Actinobacteria bacterium]|uniref:Unannotated protein n=1 Tax=freshwater metagenome TaxID=449393 RepID=A0A6J7D1S1_9ZZZZ|nr:hypothetical protein [Actinomycetota bacterium]
MTDNEMTDVPEVAEVPEVADVPEVAEVPEVADVPETVEIPEVADVPAKPEKASSGAKASKPNARERWRLAELTYSDAVWAILEDDTAVLTKETHKELKDLRYAADDRQRKYFKSLKKK